MLEYLLCFFDPPIKPDVTGWPAVQQTFEKFQLIMTPPQYSQYCVLTLRLTHTLHKMLGIVGTVWGHSWLGFFNGLLYSRPASYIIFTKMTVVIFCGTVT